MLAFVVKVHSHVFIVSEIYLKEILLFQIAYQDTMIFNNLKSSIVKCWIFRTALIHDFEN